MMEGYNPRSRGAEVTVVMTALLVALGLHVFAYRAGFAPGGMDGLAAILSTLSGRLFGVRINTGILTLALNLPLLLAAALLLRRRYVLLTLLYTGSLSLFLLLLELLGVYQYDCLTGGGDPLIAAIFGGAAQGLTGIPLRLGGSSGGVDVIGGMLAVRYPHKNVERLIAYVSYLVVALAFFVYGDLGAVCLSAISVFVCERVSSAFLRPTRGALRFEIVAPPDVAAHIRAWILLSLRHGVTLLFGEGGLSGERRAVIVCLVSYRRLPELMEFLGRQEGVFLSYGEALGVFGNFDRVRGAERPEDVCLREKYLENEWHTNEKTE